MVTKGIIKSIDLLGNTCTVHIPFFETAGNDQIIETATVSNTPGSYNGYKVGDVVYVAFEDGSMSNPVIIGKLYLGTEKEKADPRGVSNVEESSAAKKATLPADAVLAAEIDKSVPNTTVPYTSLSSIANSLNKLNTDVAQNDRDYGNRFKQVISSIEDQEVDFTSKLEQTSKDITAEVNKKVSLESGAEVNKGLGWTINTDKWEILAKDSVEVDSDNDGVKDTVEERSFPIFQVTREGVSVSGELKLTGYSKETIITYTQTTSNTEKPKIKPEDTDGYAWSTEIPAWKEGYYIWQRTVVKAWDYNKELYNDLLKEYGVWEDTIVSDNIVCLAGASAATYYITATPTQVTYDPNTNSYSPENKKVTYSFYRKVGTGAPELLTDPTFKCSINGDAITFPTSGTGEVEVIDLTTIILYTPEGLIAATTTIPVTSGGVNAVSPVKLEIDNDYDSIPCDYEGVISNYKYAEQTLHTLRLYEGIDAKDFKLADAIPENNEGYIVIYTLESGITATLEPALDAVSEYSAVITALTSDKAKITYKVYKDTDTTVLATGSFTAEKRYSSAPTVKIDITNDFVSIPCNSSKTPSWNEDTFKTETTHTISVYEGLTAKSFTVSTNAPTISGTSYYVHQRSESDEVTVVNSAMSEAAISYTNKISELKTDVGTITYDLYKGTTKIGSVKFEATKIVAGADGESYKLVASASQIKQDKTGTKSVDSITFSARKQIGNSTASAFSNAYFKVYVDSTEIRVGEGANTTSIGRVTNGEYAVNTAEVTNEIKAEIYYDSAYTILLDRETIPVVVDGEDLVDYYVLINKDRIVYDPNDTENPYPEGNSVRFTFWKQVGSGTPSELKALSTTDDSFQYSLNNGATKINIPTTGYLELSVTESTTLSLYTKSGVLLDTKTVSVISDGTDGAQGIQGVSITSQTTYYALIDPTIKAGWLAPPESDSNLQINVYGNTEDLEDPEPLSSARTAESEWQLQPPAHTSTTIENGWKYWTTVRTVKSDKTIGYSTPIINEEVDGAYKLAQGKTTNYYQNNDPAGNKATDGINYGTANSSQGNNIKKGDCWFQTIDATDPNYNTEYESNSEAAEASQGILRQWTGSDWEDIGGELVANKLTANYINALDITTKKITVPGSTNNKILFQADGSKSQAEERVQIAGFNVHDNTLTTGSVENGNLIKINSDNTNNCKIGALSPKDRQDSSWATGVAVYSFKTNEALTDITYNGKAVKNLFTYYATNSAGGNTFSYSASKIIFTQAISSFTLYLRAPNTTDSGDEILATGLFNANSDGTPYEGTIPTAIGTGIGEIKGISEGTNTGSDTTSEVTYTNIKQGQCIYIIYRHFSTKHNTTNRAYFYLPASIRFSVGENFQVLADGTVYAKNLFLGTSATASTFGDTGTIDYSDNAVGKLNAIQAQLNCVEVVNPEGELVFKADGRDTSAENNVQIGGFTVTGNTLTSGSKDTDNLITLSSEPYYTIKEVTLDEFKEKMTDGARKAFNSTSNSYSLNPLYHFISTAAVKLPALNEDGDEVLQLHHVYSSTNAGKHSSFSIAKIIFNQDITSLNLQLRSGEYPSVPDIQQHNDYVWASIKNPANGSCDFGLQGNGVGAKGSTQGRASQFVEVTYEDIKKGNFIYIVYIKGDSSNEPNAEEDIGSFYMPNLLTPRLTIGKNFEVLSDGTTYASNLFLTKGSNETVAGELAAISASLNHVEVTTTDGNQTIFKADGREKDANGNTITDANRVQIGGFVVNDSKISTGTFGAEDSLSLSTADQAGTLGNEHSDAWRMSVGQNFGIKNDGTIYSLNGIFDGEITASSCFLNDVKAFNFVGDKLNVGGMELAATSLDNALTKTATVTFKITNGVVSWNSGGRSTFTITITAYDSSNNRVALVESTRLPNALYYGKFTCSGGSKNLSNTSKTIYFNRYVTFPKGASSTTISITTYTAEQANSTTALSWTFSATNSRFSGSSTNTCSRSNTKYQEQQSNVVLSCSGGFIPATNEQGTLGSPNAYWGNIYGSDSYLKNIEATGNVTSTGQFIAKSGGATVFSVNEGRVEAKNLKTSGKVEFLHPSWDRYYEPAMCINKDGNGNTITTSPNIFWATTVSLSGAGWKSVELPWEFLDYSGAGMNNKYIVAVLATAHFPDKIYVTSSSKNGNTTTAYDVIPSDFGYNTEFYTRWDGTNAYVYNPIDMSGYMGNGYSGAEEYAKISLVVLGRI